MSGLEILSFGCRLNFWEGEAMRGLAEAGGLRDAIIVNSCAVTAEAERQSRQAIRRAARERPGVPVIVTGCAAQLNPAAFADMPEVSRVLGNDDKLRSENWQRATEVASVQVSDIMVANTVPAPHLDRLQGRARAFLQVQQGCDHRCTFCIIPFARGPSRSLALGEIAGALRRAVDSGYREVVLTGVDLTAWGSDLPGQPTLGQMVRRLLRLVPELERLRLSSLDPAEIDEPLWQALAEEERLMPHLHLSVQSGDDLILKRMKRRHSRAQVLAAAARARAVRPDIVLGADFIAGFPTETEAAFQNSCDLVAEAGLTYLHVFPYSQRPGTPAARMPALSGIEVKARAKVLRQLGEARLDGFLANQIGRTARIVMERGGIGHTEHHAPVRPSQDIEIGASAAVRLVAIKDRVLQGEPI